MAKISNKKIVNLSYIKLSFTSNFGNTTRVAPFLVQPKFCQFKAPDKWNSEMIIHINFLTENL